MWFLLQIYYFSWIYLAIQTPGFQHVYSCVSWCSWCIESSYLLLLWKNSHGKLLENARLFIWMQLARTSRSFAKILYYYDWKYAEAHLLPRIRCFCVWLGKLFLGNIWTNINSFKWAKFSLIFFAVTKNNFQVLYDV